MRISELLLAGAVLVGGVAWAAEAPVAAANPEAVREVQAGTRTEANAAWWGFNDEDATDAVQGAIDSGAKRVIVPNVGRDWIVRPIKLRSDLELVLEEGVAIVAKRGEYRGKGDSVFTARDAANLAIRGKGATVRMQKEDYIAGLVLKDLGWNRWFGQYEKAEWRMCLGLHGCENVEVEGVTLRDSGGDGIYVAGGSENRPCRNVRIRGVVCDNNYRQGISIISADGLTVEDSVFKNTWGTPPSSGVDIEPDSPEEQAKGILFRNCRFEDNYGDGIEVFLANLKPESEPVSIVFEDCYVTSRRGPGIRVTKMGDNGPSGLVEFRRCTVENTEAYGIKVQDKSADRARVRFVECVLRNTANNRGYRDAWAPVALRLLDADMTSRFGGIDFVDCRIVDDLDRPAIVFEGPAGAGLHDITGTLSVENPHGVSADLGASKESVGLSLR